MESSVTIPLAYYEEIKKESERFKSLSDYNAKSIIMTSEYGCQYMNILCEIRTIRVLESEIVYLKESLNAKLEEKRSPFGLLNKIYLYFKK